MSIWSLLAYEGHFESLWDHFVVTFRSLVSSGRAQVVLQAANTQFYKVFEGPGGRTGKEAAGRPQGGRREAARRPQGCYLPTPRVPGTE